MLDNEVLLEKQRHLQEPYAYEYGRDNGDGTFSVVMNKGMITQLGENEYGYCHPGIFASKEWPVTPLYLHPLPAPEVVELLEALEGIVRIIDDSRGVDGYHLNGAVAEWDEFEEVSVARDALAAYRKQGGIAVAPVVQGGSAEQCNHRRIGWELERTAMGDGYYGNALRAAKDIPGLTDQDRAVLCRYAAGSQRDTDHIALQDIAMRVYTTSQPTEQIPATDVAVLVEALNVVKTVLESDDPAIADTVWVPDAPETLLDHVCAALAAHRQQGGE